MGQFFPGVVNKLHSLTEKERSDGRRWGNSWSGSFFIFLRAFHCISALITSVFTLCLPSRGNYFTHFWRFEKLPHDPSWSKENNNQNHSKKGNWDVCNAMRSGHHHKICLLLAQKSLTHCRIRFFFDHFRISSKGAFYWPSIPIWGTAESSEDQNATLWGNSKQRIWLVFPTWIAKFRADVFMVCCESFELLRIWYDTLWDQFLTVPISNMRALSCYLKCWESLPKQSDQVITFDQQVKLTFSWWCSRILFAFKSTIVASKVKRQIMNSIRSNVAEYWVDHKYWKHHKAIKRKSSQHPRFISTFYESRTNAKDFKNEGDFQVAMN